MPSLAEAIALIGPPPHGYRRRTEWQRSTEPIRSDRRPIWSRQRCQTCHWPGGPARIIADANGHITDARVIDYLRRMQHDYLTRRGYSVGYNVLIDPRGPIWEARGFDFRCAAQGGRTSALAVQNNIEGMAFQLFHFDVATATVPQIASARWWNAAVRLWAPQARIVNGHRDVNSTACPDPYYPQVLAGVFDPAKGPPKPPGPLPPPTTEGDIEDMVIIRHRTNEGVELAYMVSGGYGAPLTGEQNVASAAAAGVPVFYVNAEGWFAVQANYKPR